jgi:minor extracellular serine protease Vpr
MDDQKIENLLNLSLDATPEEREKSSILSVGYDPSTHMWDLIVKYSGEISRIEEVSEDIQVVELLDEYAIITIPEIYIQDLVNVPEVEYIEKPKQLFLTVDKGRTASCINAVQTQEFNLFGTGTIVAVVDSGVDYSHPDFRNEDGTTRILALWDQTIPGKPPEGYRIGTEYTRENINEALSRETRSEQEEIVPSKDVSGHGTAVLGIAAGNGRASEGRYRGVASRADIIVVKLGIPRPDSFPRTTELMQGVDYVVRKSLEFHLPAAINLSFGNTYGSHDGTSLLETFLDDISNLWKISICVGTGNEGAAAGHAGGILTMDVPYKDIELSVGNGETGFSVQVWKSYVDQMDIALIHPSGRMAGPFQEELGAQRFVLQGTEVLIYYGEPSPYSQAQEIFFDFVPANNYIDSGVWVFRLIPKRIVIGEYNMWLPSAGVLNEGTRFYQPSENTTLTIPSTANKVIAVGAYDSRLQTYAAFSGRGRNDMYSNIRPDLVAPGVDIMTTNTIGDYSAFTGTSFATPFVTGSAALLMEYGIVNGKDPFLYGEKLRAYLLRGARPLMVENVYPNNTLGYGTLCVRDSLP